MKTSFRFRLLPLFLIGMLAFSACDSALTENRSDNLAATSLDDYASTLNDELGLTNDQYQTLRNTMARYEDREPGALWRVAADLQETLTDEQKERLLSFNGPFGGPNQGQGFRQGQRGGPHGGPGSPGMGSPGMGGPGMRGQGMQQGPGAGALFDLLTDEQKAQIEELHTAFRAEVEPLHDALREGTLSREDFRTQVQALHEELKAAVEALLTDEQKAELERLREERMQGREERQAEAKAVRDDVLGLDAATSSMFDAAIEAHRDEVQALRGEVRGNGAIDREALHDAISELRAAYVASLGDFLDAVQLEIVQIHGALAHKMPKGKGARGRGGPGAGPGGPGFGPGGGPGGGLGGFGR